ncbi:acyl-CoA dehydrogenase family protein [Amycolatopsis keratiniphila]|uniref:acyl-CoA dehydrogenase family protein n=1 Tax=Amycolatopsis keratiniphila TaxID=129921 RepID=UPI00087B6FCE|nr:acyl-CoA dehydrogenase family protein [Amycolatopsis keratiniphila]OLZ51515.1 acyl-CoA dehydrogenase [Amycolatopsis keratiniphila subsp. nogabecina]SDU65878.1 Acyl-CoA dehydrogenase [Amycolatopsis keratiniphila]
MDFALTEDQTGLKAAARTYLEDTYGFERIASLADEGGQDLAAWQELVRQGWLDPDLGLAELVLLAEEGGRVLHPVPWFATAGLALPVYHAAGVGLPGPATLADGSGTCRATRRDDGWRLDGAVQAVLHADVAAEIVVAARTPAGVALFGVDPAAVSLSARDGVDPLRAASDVALAGAAGRLLAGPPSAAPLLAAIRSRATTLLAGEAIGVADRALAIAVDHAKTRSQFDRPIGSFQAVSQQLADGYAEVELARSLAYRAAVTPSTEAVACAAHAASRAAVSVCETAIQVCGGMGVTWEFPLHRWFRRALWLEAGLASGGLEAIAHSLFGEHS